jgi:hypothetical protein
MSNINVTSAWDAVFKNPLWSNPSTRNYDGNFVTGVNELRESLVKKSLYDVVVAERDELRLQLEQLRSEEKL